MNSPCWGQKNISCATESNNQKLPHEILIKLVVEVDQRETATQVSQDVSVVECCPLYAGKYHPEKHEAGRENEQM